ncbi:MAG TPA: hypothetical protein EYH29_02370 [Caldilineales bacterium]|nr:hypothetical protein [Caldilineales bacterium]
MPPAMIILESPKPLPNPAPLERVPGLTKSQIETLKKHWIISIQEFTALGDLPSFRQGLAKLLGVEAPTLATILNDARDQLSQMRGHEVNVDLDDVEYASGALEPPPALRAEIEYERIPYEAPMPPALSYADELPPTRNQGARGTCVAFAAAAVREFLAIQQYKRLGKKPDLKTIDFSEQFIYWWCKEQDGLPAVSGTYPYLGMKCLLEAGAPRESTWRYNPHPTPGNEGQGPPPQKAVEDAARHRIGRIIHLRPDDIDSMKGALLQGHSVMIAIPIYPSWFHSRTTRKFGKINLPLPDEKPLGAHAMALAGYVDDETAPGRGYFIVRNAWSPWGQKNPFGSGLGLIPYAFLQKHNSIADAALPLVTADVYLRDNEDDRGSAPSRGLTFNSPDIWVRRKPDGEERHQPPVAGEAHWIYVRAWNLGPERATQVRAQVFIAPASPSIWPEMWREVGEIELGDIEPQANAIASLQWTPEAHPSSRILVRLHAAEDPAQHLWAVRYDNNIAQKNVVHLQVRPGETARFTFPIYGLPGELTLRRLRVDRQGFRNGRIDLSIEKAQAYRKRERENDDAVLKRFASQATESRMAVLTIHMKKGATAQDGGRIIINQSYGKTLVGRMMVVVEVASRAENADDAHRSSAQSP